VRETTTAAGSQQDADRRHWQTPSLSRLGPADTADDPDISDDSLGDGLSSL
jgi:hypothetical protein